MVGPGGNFNGDYYEVEDEKTDLPQIPLSEERQKLFDEMCKPKRNIWVEISFFLVFVILIVCAIAAVIFK